MGNVESTVSVCDTVYCVGSAGLRGGEGAWRGKAKAARRLRLGGSLTE